MESMANNGGRYTVSKDEQNHIFDVMRHASANNGPTESVENLVQIPSRRAMFKNRNFFKNLSIALLVLVIVLFIAFIIILSCYVKERNSVCHGNKICINQEEICTTKECLRTASSFKLSMDMTVDPCDDFYEFSCGHWSEEHPNHGWYPKFSNFEVIEERVDMAALNFLMQNDTKDDPLPVKQSRMFFQSCMDVESRDKLGYSVIFKYLKQLNLPLVPSFFKGPDAAGDVQFDWIYADVALKRILDMDLFVGFTVDVDIFNRTNNVMYMGAPSASSPLPSPFKTKTPSRKFWRTLEKENPSNQSGNDVSEALFKKTVKHIMNSIISNVTGPPDGMLLENATNILWNMTFDIEEMATVNETQEEDIITIKLETLQKSTDEFIEKFNGAPYEIWGRYFNLMFQGIPNVTLDLSGKDLIHTTEEDLKYLYKIVYILSQTPDVILELYTWWITVQSMIINTTSEMIQYITKATSQTKAYSVARLRSLDCAELVIKFMGIAVSYGIAEKAFLNETKPKVEEMLKDIKIAFVHRVKEITWMDEATKKVTLEKNKEMLSFIGFPEWLMDKEEVENYYDNITIKNDTYLENLMAFVTLYFPFRLSSLREENERSWIVDPTTVNAFNYFGENSIYVPMAILTFPMYDLGLEVLNYGSIGSILGHELTHGFDNSGRQYDQNGNYRQWWSNETIHTFVNKTECLVKQYDQYKLPPVDINIQGKMTLGENIADNGGLHHAYLAYQNYLRTHPPDKKLPGFENFTNNQMFFLAFGSIWCEERNPQLLKEQILTDSHCPSPIRVKGTLQNSHEFAEAFNCPIGSRMNPNRTRCRIW